MRATIMASLAFAVTALAVGTAGARDQTHPQSKFGELDHVFLIMMENQTNTDILGKPERPVHQ